MFVLSVFVHSNRKEAMTVGLKVSNMSRSWFVPEVYEYRSAQRGVLFLESSPDDVVYRVKNTSMLPQSQISYNIFMKSEDFNFHDQSLRPCARTNTPGYMSLRHPIFLSEVCSVDPCAYSTPNPKQIFSSTTQHIRTTKNVD